MSPAMLPVPFPTVVTRSKPIPQPVTAYPSPHSTNEEACSMWASQDVLLLQALSGLKTRVRQGQFNPLKGIHAFSVK